MRDPDRIDFLLSLVAQVWRIDPDLRLGQLLVNAAVLGGWEGAADIFSAEDRVIEKGLHRLLERDTHHSSEDRPSSR